MSNQFLTPVGRLVQGSLYDAQTKDKDGNLLLDKNKQLTSRYFFAIAIPKNLESHWNQTEWGVKIWEEGKLAFPAVYQHPTFHWKIIDGDSHEVDIKTGKSPRDKPGHVGCWVLKCSSQYAPSIVHRDGRPLPTKDYITPGSYIAAFIGVLGNASTQSPGVYLNHQYVAFMGFGEPIVFGIDPSTIGFDKLAVPAGASATPYAAPAGTVAPTLAPPVAAAVVVEPHPQILAGPAIAPPPAAIQPSPIQRVMAPGAPGTYEQMLAAGWTDELLIQHQMMLP